MKKVFRRFIFFVSGYIYREKFFLGLIFILALIIRSVYVIVIYRNSGTSNWSDDWYYSLLGEQLASGDWAPHAENELYMRVAPWIPLLLAFFNKLFGSSFIPFFIYNILLSSLLIPVLYYLGREISGKTVGKILAIWACLNVEFFRYTPHLLKEPTIYFLMPLIILLIIKQIKKENYYIIILAAFLFSVLIHTDERFIFYLPIFPLILFFGHPFNFKKSIKGTFAWIAVVFLLMVPWGIRNYKTYGQVVIISHRTTAFTSMIWGKDLSGMKFVSSDEDIENQYKSYSEAVVNVKSSKKSNSFNLYSKTLINIWRPAYFKTRVVKYSWWDKPRLQKWSLKHNLLSLLFYGIYLPFFLIGIIISALEKNYLVFFLSLLPVIHSILHAYMVMPEERYRYPFVFLIVLVGVWTITEIIRRNYITGFMSRKYSTDEFDRK